MKTIIIMVIVGIIAFFSIKSLIKSLTGKSGCGGCSKSKGGSCSVKYTCPSKKFTKQN